jgi:uncharacterized protein YkwD
MQRLPAIIAAIVAGTLILAALIPTNAAQAQTGEPAAIYKSYLPMIAGPTTSQTPAEQAVADEVLDLVNSERAKAGCGPLTLEAKLTDAAQGHSEDMARNDYFDHTALDGSSAADRVTRTGYDWRMTGENIAAGYSTAAEVMDGWMKSPGHRANILNCGFTQLGVGYYYETDDSYPGPYGYSYYWTQVFGTP